MSLYTGFFVPNPCKRGVRIGSRTGGLFSAIDLLFGKERSEKILINGAAHFFSLMSGRKGLEIEVVLQLRSLLSM